MIYVIVILIPPKFGLGTVLGSLRSLLQIYVYNKVFPDVVVFSGTVSLCLS